MVSRSPQTMLMSHFYGGAATENDMHRQRLHGQPSSSHSSLLCFPRCPSANSTLSDLSAKHSPLNSAWPSPPGHQSTRDLSGIFLPGMVRNRIQGTLVLNLCWLLHLSVGSSGGKDVSRFRNLLRRKFGFACTLESPRSV